MRRSAAIYIDFDDVLCETAMAFIGIAEGEFGKGVPFDSIRTFDLAESFNLDPDEYERLMHLGHQDAFLAAIAPVPGAIDGVRAWSHAGYRICVMTGRPPSTVGVSRDWLQRHEVPFDELYFVDKYSRTVDGHSQDGATTLEELRRREFVWAVEDAPRMAAWLCVNMTMPVVVIERPWNRADAIAAGDAARRLHRCRNWAEISATFPSASLREAGH